MDEDRTVVGFTVNHYDRDSDIVFEAIYLHVGDNLRITFTDLAAMKQFRDDIGTCIREIEDTYPNEGVTKR